ncbi:OLC1v1007362C1 [Oldenlandia corymbosa var. corymbosa]|uniref:OLC1v1007362C1 n=1 Tax=Oldenlandia corymbosa var. corymbosa TaxID=529605 RepID=A0AAV1DJC6_OLDCO|nr:OLC1v1007362C1 [Oldenlandia corymbosa var. corymbosa]
MAIKCFISSTYTISLIFLFCFSPAPSVKGQQPLFSPIHKDNSTKLYSIQAYFGTPLQLRNLFLDLGAKYNWLDCTGYQSSTYQHVLYNATLCDELDTRVTGNCTSDIPGPDCSYDACELFPENSVTRKVGDGEILTDTLALPTTNGRNPGNLALDSSFAFGCTNTQLLSGLPSIVTGVAALGRFNFSFPGQVSRAFSSPFVFAICAPSTTSANGVAIYNSFGPYLFLPGIDLSKSLSYTPLLLNPIDTTIITYVRPSNEYFIGLTGIRVNGKPIPINQTLLTINQTTGFGGTKISTSTPYTVLETSIFKTFTTAFKEAADALNLTYAAPRKPFNQCYRTDTTPTTRLGPAVPTIDLLLEDNVVWSIFGANSMVKYGESRWCLGFVDGGLNPHTPIVIGGLQIEDNLLQFDLVSKRLGFSNSLLSRSTNCSNFNFTTSN